VLWAQEEGERVVTKKSGRQGSSGLGELKIDGHQRPWAASRLGQGIAPPRRPRSGGATAAPQTPTQRRRRSSGSTVIRKCRRYPCEAAPRCCVIVPRGDFKGKLSPSYLILGSLFRGVHNPFFH